MARAFLRISVLTCCCLFFCISEVAGFDYYGGDAGPKSTQYNVTMLNGGKRYIPHVYGILPPSDDTNGHNDNSTDNWIEFEQHQSDTTQIIIKRLIGAWPADTHIRPISYGIPLQFNAARDTVSFNVSGNALHFSVHYGSDTDKGQPDTAIQSSMLVFITPPDIVPPQTPNTKTFHAGQVYNLTDGGYPAGTGVFAVNETSNANVDQIVIQRGAWVYGKIFINKTKNPPSIYGPGVLSGRYCSRAERENASVWNAYVQMLAVNNRPLDIIGVTVVTPNFRFYDHINGQLQYFRGIGWLGNNGGGIFGTGSVLADSFFKTDDDTVKFKQNFTSKNIVLWHGYNAAAFQWGDFGQSYSEPVRAYNWTIIASENSLPNVYDGTDTEHRSNSIFAKAEGNGSHINGPFEFHNFVVDCNVSNLILWQLGEGGYMKNIRFYNLIVRGQIMNFNMMNTLDNSAEISNIEFHNFTINGKQIMDIEDPEFKFKHTGNVDLDTITFYKS